MFETIRDLIPRDRDCSARAHTLTVLKRVLDGSFYDVLPHEFHEERGAGGEYIPLRHRRPSVRYALCRVVVEDAVALLFSESHFPTIDSSDPAVRAALADLIKESRLNQVMIEAAMAGSIGSAAILLRVLRGRVFLDVLDTTFLTPTWDPEAPDTLASVTERYKVSGAQLLANGYDIADPGASYWFTRHWDTQTETWFHPQPVGATEPPVPDAARGVHHGLGFVPLVWVKNLPGPSASGDNNDGACTFRAAIETQIEIDYQLSQAGRGLKYSSDPTLLIKEPAAGDAEIVKGAGNALVVSEKGDAKLLEIGGTASAAVMEYVRTLREFALESVHGNRATDARRTRAWPTCAHPVPGLRRWADTSAAISGSAARMGPVCRYRRRRLAGDRPGWHAASCARVAEWRLRHRKRAACPPARSGPGSSVPAHGPIARRKSGPRWRGCHARIPKRIRARYAHIP